VVAGAPLVGAAALEAAVGLAVAVAASRPADRAAEVAHRQ
jgi:hypothetical protein